VARKNPGFLTIYKGFLKKRTKIFVIDILENISLRASQCLLSSFENYEKMLLHGMRETNHLQVRYVLGKKYLD
jgi:hypothetical protein